MSVLFRYAPMDLLQMNGFVNTCCCCVTLSDLDHFILLFFCGKQQTPHCSVRKKTFLCVAYKWMNEWRQVCVCIYVTEKVDKKFMLEENLKRNYYFIDCLHLIKPICCHTIFSSLSPQTHLIIFFTYKYILATKTFASLLFFFYRIAWSYAYVWCIIFK